MKGGQGLEQWLRDISTLKSSTIEVGFFQTARYVSGDSVATVAAENEFGKKGVPARPFFRLSIEEMADSMTDVVKTQIDVQKGEVNPQLPDHLGLWASAIIAETITTLTSPPNSPITIARKKSSNPLIDTGKMRNSVTWKVLSS